MANFQPNPIHALCSNKNKNKTKQKLAVGEETVDGLGNIGLAFLILQMISDA